MNAIVQERRHITILFSDLSDSTGIAAGLDPELFADLLGQIRDIAFRIMPAHGGEIIRIDGDGILCIFGYPTPYEDAGRRATEAALDLHAGMSALNDAFAPPDRPLRLHTGIHAGLVLLRAGDLVRGRYEVLGDPTNIAARLCDAALPGEILVSAETLALERHFFLTDYMRSIPHSSRAQPVDCWPVTGRSNLLNRYEARAKAGLTPFQGRGPERRALFDWLNHESGDTPLLLIHGPAGIGKSRFLSIAAEAAQERGWRVARGYCEAYLSARPLQPFLQIADALHGLSAAIGIEGASAIDQLDALAAGSDKLLLIVDDWQWADDASHDKLASLLTAPRHRQLKILIASRENELPLAAATRVAVLAVPPLDRRESLAAIEMLLRSPDPFAIERIEQASGGSPLLIEELCHAFGNGAATPTQDPRGPWFDQAVQARFAELTSAEQELLKLSAVIGHIIPVWLIAALLGARLNNATLMQLQERDFLFPGDTEDIYRFKHGLTRDAIYASISLAERRSLHKDILSALEDEMAVLGRGALLDSLAYHSLAAGVVEKGLPYAVEAGDAALGAGSLDRAQAHYLAAIDAAEKLADSDSRRDWFWLLLNKFGLACIVDPAPDQLAVLARIEAILKKGGSTRHAMRSAYWLGSIAYGVGNGKNSVRFLQTALDIAAADNAERDANLARIKLAQSLFASGQPARARAIFAEHLPRMIGDKERNNHEITAYAHACYGFLCADCGDFAAAQLLFDQSEVVLCDSASATNSSILLYRAAALVAQGQWQQAIATADAVLAVSQRSRTRFQNRTCRAQAAYSRWQLTRDPEAVEALERAASLFLVSGNSLQHASMVFGWLVHVMLDIGDKARARLYMGNVMDRRRVGGDRLGEAMAWRALARLASAGDDPHRVNGYLAAARRAAAARLSRREVAQNRLCEGEILIARGEALLAKPILDEAACEFAAMDMPFFQARAIRLASR